MGKSSAARQVSVGIDLLCRIADGLDGYQVKDLIDFKTSFADNTDSTTPFNLQWNARSGQFQQRFQPQSGL